MWLIRSLLVIWTRRLSTSSLRDQRVKRIARIHADIFHRDPISG
jgi:hypothetical protein